ncbi:MAG: amidinotransferase [Chloroflexi bacterium]|nr:amidinotransferase [Chloroflexota bacterium]
MSVFLMCPPDYFGIEYEINAWMRLSNQSDLVHARAQWQKLYRILTEELGAKVELMKPEKGLPDLVFTANAGYVEGDLFVSSAFKYKERQGETPFFDAWFQSHGYRVLNLGPDCVFEGMGDALPFRDTVFAAYRHRSEVCSHKTLGEILNRRVISLELVNPKFYHLDTCFCPLGNDSALFFPPAFDDYARRVLKESIPDLIAVSDSSAHRFACNAIVVDKTVVTNSGCNDFETALSERGYKLRMTELGEFMKSGGSARCLTLRLE